jgi:hypothetical protein
MSQLGVPNGCLLQYRPQAANFLHPKSPITHPRLLPVIA